MKYAIVILLAACMLCAVVQAIELPLKYERYPDNEEEYQFRPFGWLRIEWTDKAPDGEWKLPKTNGNRPLFGWIEIGEQKRLMLMDKSNGNAKFYDRIHFDANANRDLTDEAAVNAINVEGSENYLYANFPALDVTVLVDGLSMPYSFRMYVHYYEPVNTGYSPPWWDITSFFKKTPQAEKVIALEQLSTSLSINCMYTTELNQDGAAYKIWLADYNGNGRFDDLGTIEVQESIQEGPLWAQGDTLYLAPKDVKMSYSEFQFLGKYLNLKDTLFTIAISHAEKRLTLTPVTEGISRIELPAPVYRISLLNNEAGVMSCMPEKTVLVPPGSYQLLSYVLFRDEPSGARWQLRATASGNSPTVTVAAGESKTYVLGDPFRPVVSVPEWSRTNFASAKSVNLNMFVVGAGKEFVQDLVCIGNHEKSSIPLSRKEVQKPKEATYKILKQDGEVVTQGAFEYG